MNKTQKILIGAVLLLVIINIVLMGFIWINRPEGRHRGEHRRSRPEISTPMLHRELNLTREQRHQLQGEWKAHRNKMHDFNREFLLRKHRVNQAIIAGDSSALEKANDDLFQTQKAMEKETQKLTAELAAICTEEQKAQFLKTMDDVLQKNQAEDR